MSERHAVFTKKKASFAFADAVAISAYRRFAVLEPVRADRLQVGQKVAIVRRLPHPRFMFKGEKERVTLSPFVGMELNEDLMILIGLWLGDGSLNHGKLRISSNNADHTINEFLRKMNRGPVCGCPKGDHEGAGIDFTMNDESLAFALHALDVCGRGKEARTKRVPAWVYGCSDRLIGALLRGYYSADGSFHQHVLESSTASQNLAKDISLLLTRLGVVASLRPIKKRASFIGAMPVNTGPLTRLTVSKRSQLRTFLRFAGFMQEDTHRAMETLLAEGKDPGYWEGRVYKSVFWDEVKSVEVLGIDDKNCYDAWVQDTQKFVVNSGLILHSSSCRTAEILNTVGKNQ